MLDRGQHAECVDAWLARTAGELSPAGLRRLIEAAFGALWNRTKTTLGEVTLTAIAERVLYAAAERFPSLGSLKIDPTRGIEFHGNEATPSVPPEHELRAAIRFVLVELLTVLGNLTAEILTPELHAELSIVEPPWAVRGGPGLETVPNDLQTHAGAGRKS